jgi:Rrf2 family protein
MILSKTAQYSIRILSHMSLNEEKLITASNLHNSLQISPKYLSRLLTRLTKAGFIKSIQGRNGGYVFSRDYHNIYISEIIETIDGTEVFKTCLLGARYCGNSKPCEMHGLWSDLRDKIIDKLTKTSIGDIRNNAIKDFNHIFLNN